MPLPALAVFLLLINDADWDYAIDVLMPLPALAVFLRVSQMTENGNTHGRLNAVAGISCFPTRRMIRAST